MKTAFQFLFLFVINNTNAQTQLWSTTTSGGANGWGSIYSFDSLGNNLNTHYNFNPSISKAPLGNLCLANNGNFYGITGLNQFNHDCFCYKYNPVTGVYTNIHDFFSDAVHGRNARSGLLKATNDTLYGLCANGGIHNAGVIYYIDPTTDTYNNIYDFDSINGANAFGSLIQASNGKFYGITSGGGDNNEGVIFSYNSSTNSYQKLYDFATTIGSNAFYGSLLQANNGVLYGLTQYGGVYNNGELFSFDIVTNTYNDLVDFDFTNGANPRSSVIQATDGNLYGMTYTGGTDSLGVIFRYDINTNTYSKLLDFTGINGGNPTRKLTQTNNGKLVGTTIFGGINNEGVAFSFDITNNTYNKLLDFNDTINGSYPNGEIIETNVFGTAEIN